MHDRSLLVRSTSAADRGDARSSPAFERSRGVAAALLAACLVLGAGCDDSSESAASNQKKAPPKQPESATKTAKNAPLAGSRPDDAKGAKTAESANRDDPGPVVLKGPVQPGKVTEVSEHWRERLQNLEIDEAVARKLGEVEPGATVTVYFGTWCGDSLREVPRLWKSLQAIDGDVPFDVEYVALDHALSAEGVSLKEKNIQFVPTFVVQRDGEEVGRIVESAPQTLEEDLLALLSGESEGVVSGRQDLGSE